MFMFMFMFVFIYFGVGMGNTVLRVKQPSLTYLYPFSYPYICLLFHLVSSSACLFGVQLSFQFVALYRHLPLVPLAHHTLFNFVANYCFEAEATPSTTNSPSRVWRKKKRAA